MNSYEDSLREPVHWSQACLRFRPRATADPGGLASRTQDSAKEIEELIIQLQNGAQESLDKIQVSREKSTQNADNARSLIPLFNDIREQMGYVQDMN
ncbi:hypothetical protein ACPUEK_13515 [Marinomonas gallaica]|uniref:hypothetical protein n=1 Tax=Marinomonas gallaica TaxID=1806667 RepID=UPI003CE51FBB